MHNSITNLKIPILVCICSCSWISASPFTDNRPAPPDNLKCEYQISPLGIDNPNPRLFWEINGTSRGIRQSAYQILVASHNDLLSDQKADMWNSGKVNSNHNIQVEYNGKPLESGKRYYWKVKFWDQNGASSDYSLPSWWEMGLMAITDWKGSWLYNGADAPVNDSDLYQDNPVPLFRKSFVVEKKVLSARLFISGLGYYEAYLNGKKIGDHMLDPGWTNYSRRIQYVTYDITEMLRGGDNAIGIILGNGWYNPMPLYLFNRLNLRKVLSIGQPKFISQLSIEYSDGSKLTVASDETWKTGPGPILMNSVYLGERYDARLEQDGWDMPGFDDSNWKKAVRADSPGGKLVAEIQPPVRITKLIKPVNISEPKPAVFIFDMGQNFAGVARLKVTGAPGTTVRLRYGELLNDDGTLNDKSTMACHIMEGSYVQQRPGAPKNADQTDTYNLKGKGEEIYNSRFTFHGFRYVEVTGFPGKPSTESLTGLRMNSDLPQAGSFECSNPMFNKIQQNTLWTFLSNVFSIESDCPGREKFGYGGDIVAASEAYIYNFDMSNFYTKTVQNFQDDQRPGGGMPECAPDNTIYDAGLTHDTGPIGWMLAYPWTQQKLYLYYGDKKIIKEQYESTKRLIEFIRANAPDHIIEKGISDHESMVRKPVLVTGTAFYYHHVKMLADFAQLLGKTDESGQYQKLATDIREAFINKFLAGNDGKVDFGSQACQAFGLYYNLIPEKLNNQALEILKNDIVNANNNHLTTGIFGTKMLFEVLRQNNMNDITYAINNQKSMPGYGYMIEHGATTIWESWRGGGSHNHPMFGSVSEWFYKSLAGIIPAGEACGFDKIIIHPYFAKELDWVKSSYHSIRGLIESNWKRVDDKLVLKVTIPGNTEALIYLPSISQKKISEGGKIIGNVKDLKFLKEENGCSVYSAGSGKYEFEFSLPDNESSKAESRKAEIMKPDSRSVR